MPKPKDLLNQPFFKYGCKWAGHSKPAYIELDMIRRGGRWKKQSGVEVGNGLLFHYKEFARLAWPNFDQHRWFDFTLEHWLANKYVGIIGPSDCVAAETRLPNPITGEAPTIGEFYESGVAPVVMTRFGPAVASVPFVKGVSDLYRVTLSDGNSFVATLGHRVLTPSGYVAVRALCIGSQLSGDADGLPRSTSDISLLAHASSAHRSIETVADSQCYCPICLGFCDAQPQSVTSISQGVFPFQGGAPRRDSLCRERYAGGPGDRAIRSRLCPQSSRRANLHCLSRGTLLETSVSRPSISESPVRGGGLCLSPSRSLSGCGFPDSFAGQVQSADTPRQFLFSCPQSSVQQITVTSIKFVRRDTFYDLTVPFFGHYFAEGAIHHNSGKSAMAALFHLTAYYAFPSKTTVIVCSTTKENMEDRIWGEIKKRHRQARNLWPLLPGHLIEGRMRLITDDREESEDGRDYRNGFVGVPCLKGSAAAGLTSFVGRKNDYLFLVGDELQFIPNAFLDSTANLDGGDGSQRQIKVTGMGNPSEITSTLGMLCEPSQAIGGWESGIDQTPKTKVWPTRINAKGVCIQLPGADCPNMDVADGEPVPFPYLITRQKREDQAKRWGVDDWHFSMFCDGRFPRGQGSRRVITRELCIRGRALDQPVWANTARTKIASLDSAFRAVGGDRCVFTRCEFGPESPPPRVDSDSGELLLANQDTTGASHRQVFALIEQKIIPLKATEIRGAALTIEEAEDQIVKFCMAECEQYGIAPENFFFDAGMKASLVAAFARLWSPKINPVDFDGRPTERKVSKQIEVLCKDYYFNFVTEMWYSWRMVIDAGQFRGLTEAVMLEGCKREFEKVAGNKIQVEPKAEMKKKTGESPDLADSLVISIEGARRKGFQIAKVENKQVSEADSKWKREAMEQAAKLWQSGQLTYK
jgi:hypothetical protein